jgi:predicted RNA-binding protein
MCEWRVVVRKGGEEEEIMEEASLIKDDGSMIIVEGTFGQRKEVKGRIVEVDADRHEILISSDERTQD